MATPEPAESPDKHWLVNVSTPANRKPNPPAGKRIRPPDTAEDGTPGNPHLSKPNVATTRADVRFSPLATLQRLPGSPLWQPLKPHNPSLNTALSTWQPSTTPRRGKEFCPRAPPQTAPPVTLTFQNQTLPPPLPTFDSAPWQPFKGCLDHPCGNP